MGYAGNGRRQAIVLGGSMAGLLAARVLSEHFDTVTLLERDPLPETAGHRRGVPQGRHTHALLASGIRVLERLFPGFGDSLAEAGGVRLNGSKDLLWYFEGGELASCDSDLDGISASRPLIEAEVRRRVRALPQVVVREGAHVMALVAEPTARRVTGVRLLTGESLSADLVVDTSGRGSRMSEWLSALGYEAPDEEKVEVGIHYVTRKFARTTLVAGGRLGVIVPPSPANRHGAVLLAQERDTWTVTLISQFSEAAPMDLEGFRDFTAHLPCRAIHDVIATAEPAAEPVHSPFPASLRRRYERLGRFPGGLLAMGDAFCSFNPIYGQGMSVAALEALALDTVLRDRSRELSRAFFARVAVIVDGPWTTAVGSDLRIPETRGPRSPIVSSINRYVSRLHRSAQGDRQLALAFHRVSNLVAPPSSLFAPAVLWRVLLGGYAEPEGARLEPSAHGRR
ncbi:MAG: hypothetical protein U0Q55_05870 [Vicinamibacterales bacterium]